MKPHTLDVRQIPNARGEPFASIMAAVDMLQPRQSLLLTAPFKPEPLLKLMQGKGFDNQVTSDPDGTWHVLFVPQERTEPEIDPSNPLTWPKPAMLMDLSDALPGKATDAILDAVKTLEPERVFFAVLGEEPLDLPHRLLDEGHFCFGRWQEGTYRVMVLVWGKRDD